MGLGHQHHSIDETGKHHGVGHGQHRGGVDDHDIGARLQFGEDCAHATAAEHLARVARDGARGEYLQGGLANRNRVHERGERFAENPVGQPGRGLDPEDVMNPGPS